MSRLSVLLDGKPVYLYSFVQGSYEEKWRFICAHPWKLTTEDVRERIAAILPLLPEEIEIDFTSQAHQPDLFEQAVVLAGFVIIEDEILTGMWAPRLSGCVKHRDSIEDALKVAIITPVAQ